MPRNSIFRLYYKLNKYDINSHTSKEAKKISYFVMKYYKAPTLKLGKFHSYRGNFPATSLLSHKENCTIGLWK